MTVKTQQSISSPKHPLAVHERTVELSGGEIAVKPGTFRIHDAYGGVIRDDAAGLLKDPNTDAVVGSINYLTGEIIGRP